MRAAMSTDTTAEQASLLDRHYSTIGIEDVFLEPPPSRLLPACYLAPSPEPSSTNNRFQTWEIVGSIKSNPEDFQVREIASRRRTPKLPVDFDLVADLATSGTLLTPTAEGTSASRGRCNEEERSISSEIEKKEVHDTVHALSNVDNSNVQNEAEATTDNSGEALVVSSPTEAVKELLTEAFGNEKAAAFVSQIQLLYERAITCIGQYPNVPCDDDNEFVWIPPVSNNRGMLHRNLRFAFPLLKSDAIKYKSGTQPPQAYGSRDATDASASVAEKIEELPWIKVSIDDSFFGLAPSLYQAEVDIPKLYLFRNRGCVDFIDKKQGTAKNNKGKKRKRSNRDGATTNDGSIVVLRLRPDLAREKRGHVHHMIQNAMKDFITSTLPNYVSQDGAKNASETCAAIVVEWSPRAKIKARKKDKRNGSSIKETKTDSAPVVNTLCVIKKTQKEHLTLIKKLVAAFRCRQSDIGLAGIKDMHAVTYQFCTIINASPKRVQKASSLLWSQGIQIGRIREVDWVLNQGDLDGNRFEIVIRNVKRIQVENNKGICSEVRLPCAREHVLSMVSRVSKHGFVNYYGEQRCGIPGKSSLVGVRSFDIGRALLQQDFVKAIDLLMAGRLVCHGENDVESPEIRNARRVWRETKDAAQTINNLPKGDGMARERIVLQGLKRYGSDNPLAALKCLPFSIRSFWINAYQSFVWNVMASERLKRFGTKVIKGDIYRSRESEGQNNIKVVEDNEASSIDIADVVLPLPGFAVEYPKNELGDAYHDFLKKENVNFDCKAPPEATAKGGYRNLIVFARNLQVTSGSMDAAQESACATREDTVADFTLKFDLPSGSYATMLLRELMVTTVARE